MSVQFIASRRVGRPITWYVYAFKGGPLIFKHEGPKKPKLKLEHHAAIAAATASRNAPDPRTLRSGIREWRSCDPNRKSSPEWAALSPGTQKVWGLQLDVIDERWGDKPLTVWNDPRMVAKVVKWRDERAATPRTADMGVTVLKALLKYLRLRGRVTINVADGIPQLYRGGDRAEIIWTDDDISRFTKAAIEEDRPHIVDGLRLAAATGLRRADLVSLTWDHLGEIAIVKTALKKSRGKRRRATVPMTEELERLIAELRMRPRAEGVEHVLVNSFGRPWSGDGFGGSFNRIRDLANIVHVDHDAEPPVRKKHLHDVRGTFCTRLMTECDLTDREIADIMAWSPERIGNIRKVYVDPAQVIVAIGARMKAKQVAKQSGGQS
ncbi:site-specific integrase [soil metagenome]